MQPDRLIQLKPREEILEVVHESALPQVPKFAFFIILLALPFFLMFPLFREGTIGVVIFFTLLIVAIFFLWRAFYVWSRTFLLVTDRRIVDFNQEGLYARTITEARYHQIDDVAYRIKGFWMTIFRLGVIEVKLEGNAADIEFHFVKRPARIADLLHDLRDDREEDTE